MSRMLVKLDQSDRSWSSLTSWLLSINGSRVDATQLPCAGQFERTTATNPLALRSLKFMCCGRWSTNIRTTSSLQTLILATRLCASWWNRAPAQVITWTAASSTTGSLWNKFWSSNTTRSTLHHGSSFRKIYSWRFRHRREQQQRWRWPLELRCTSPKWGMLNWLKRSSMPPRIISDFYESSKTQLVSHSLSPHRVITIHQHLFNDSCSQGLPMTAQDLLSK